MKPDTVPGWSVFKQIFDDHWERFQRYNPRYDRTYYDELVEKMLACGDPKQIGYTAYRCLDAFSRSYLREVYVEQVQMDELFALLSSVNDDRRPPPGMNAGVSIFATLEPSMSDRVAEEDVGRLGEWGSSRQGRNSSGV